MRSGDTRLRKTTTISGLWPTFIVPGSVTYLRSGDSRLRMTTTLSPLRPTYTVPGSVVRWTSTSELRNFRNLCRTLKIYLHEWT
ncbi:hypothetical protein HZH68_003945 [Vespula germanica]|uniref:Uncharacterized protein n=1 Tax=Vespula germanica TaxID=30212 RepID=A0A834NIZ0_VESGE|nr:hypothetical protein HZH68_003945 [Vespula germanica]